MKKINSIFLTLTILSLTFSPSTFSWPIPDTGQAKCYDNEKEIPCPQPGEPFYGQDGNHLINPPSYTKLDINGNDLPDTASEWFMVRDNVTGLIWEVKQNKDGVQDYSNPHDADNTYSWYDSNPETNGGDAGTPGDGTDTEDLINVLNVEKFGGLSDWRLPTIKELSSIAYSEEYIPVINGKYFLNAQSSGKYWSSTINSNYTDRAWYVLIPNGYEYGSNKSYSYYVRAVRAGQSRSFDHLIINDDGTVTDTATGLMWQQKTDYRAVWQNALSHCEAMTLSGYSDWRLPTNAELRSIVNYETWNLAIDANIFPDNKSSSYWSSTTGASRDTAWDMYFRGGDDRYSKLSVIYACAVRAGQVRLSDHLIILSPNQASFWNTKDLMPITWNTANISGDVKISLSRQGGKDGTFETITESTPNDGSYDWTVTGPGSYNCMLKIEPVDDPSKGTQQGLFTIISNEVPEKNKAIIVAGSGPYAENTIWPGIEMNANHAYKTLRYQGYLKENIYYLTAGQHIDLDGNSIFDDMDGDTNIGNFKYAITEWAADADDLFIYMISHGDDGVFQLNKSETLAAQELDVWMDHIQENISGDLILFYDGCLSGTFLSKLKYSTQTKNRVIVTSTSENQDSLLVDDGTLSFSFIFFSRIFHGDKFYNAFITAKNAVEYSYDYRQTPLLDGDGDGIGNQETDRQIARNVKVGKEIQSLGIIPTIGESTFEQTLSNTETLLIYAEDVSDIGGIKRVWAVISPPDDSARHTGIPITDLPVIELNPVGNNRYEAIYDQFNKNGTYHVSVFAMDMQKDISLPKTTKIHVSSSKPDILSAEFGSDKTTGNAPLTIQFTDQSTGNITSHRWDFGDGNGNISIQQNPKYTYHKAGTYQVSLTVEGTTGQNTVTKQGYITVASDNPITDPNDTNPDEGNFEQPNNVEDDSNSNNDSDGGGSGCFISTLFR